MFRISPKTRHANSHIMRESHTFRVFLTLTCLKEVFSCIPPFSVIIVRIAKAMKWLQAILDYMKKVKSITSTVFGQFS